MRKYRDSQEDPIEEGIEEFDFGSQLTPHGFFLVYGKRGSGKTVMMRLITQHTPFRNKYHHIVIAGSEEIRDLWSDIVHPINVHPPSLRFLKQIVAKQQERIRECKLLGIDFPEEWEIVIIMDDCGDEEDFMHSPTMKWIGSAGRHSHITVFCLVQKLTQAQKSNRENSDKVFTMYTGDEDSIKMLHKGYASTLPLHLFKTILAGATRQRGMLVLDSQPKTATIKDLFTHSHADFLHPDGYKAAEKRGVLQRLGAPIHWEWAEQNYKKPESHLLTSTMQKQMVDADEEDAAADQEEERKQIALENAVKDNDSNNPALITVPLPAVVPDSPDCKHASPIVVSKEGHFVSKPFSEGGLNVRFNRKRSESKRAG